MDDSRLADFKKEAEKILAHLQSEYAKLRTGRASAILVDGVMVEAYGMKQPLEAVAGISVPDARTLAIQPWDKSIMPSIEKALREMNLGLNPMNDGVLIRLVMPPMTEERRVELAKIVHQLAEEARIAIRQHRQRIHDKVKAEEKDEDLRHTLLDQLQKEVDKDNAKVEESMKKKEQEVMTV